MQKICISLVGPTAVGKTAIALQLAKQFSTSVISADSRQCFKELNIGVAKPSPAELNETEHFFVNSHHIWDEVTVAGFVKDALVFSETCFQKSNSVVLAGGTGLYVKAFLEGIDDIPPVQETIRKEIALGYINGGLPWLQDKLKTEDPDFFLKGETRNPQRCMRALEVVRQTGKSILIFQQGIKKERPFKTVKIGLDMPREQLYERINARVDKMMDTGLETEVRSLIPYRNLNALQTVGYRELFDYFEGKTSITRAVELIKQNTRHYAKRQLTWFKRDPQIHWVPANITAVMEVVQKKISAIPGGFDVLHK